LNGNKYLIPAQPRPLLEGHAKADRWLPIHEQVRFTVLDSSHVIEIGGTPVLLCHFRTVATTPANRTPGTDPTGWVADPRPHPCPQRVVDRMIVGWMPGATAVGETWIQRIIESTD
jgi:hypothetical protein